MARPLLGAMLIVVLALAACSSEQGSQERETDTPEKTSDDGTNPSEERTAGESGSDLAGLLKDPAYKMVTDNTGALKVEVPSGWEILTGKDSEEAGAQEGSSWTSFAGEGVGSSITASTDLYAWHNTSGVPGAYIVASRNLARGYTDDQLLGSGPNDFSSSSCNPGARRDFVRPPYSGRMQAWKNCGRNGETDVLTLAAAPEGRECVVLLQIGMYGEADVEAGQHILDTFEVDCRLVSSYALETPEAGQETETGSEEAADSSATGVLEKPEITSYMYGTHAITDEASGDRYALKSEEEGLLDDHVGERVTVYGTLVPGYENGQIEGGPPLLDVTRVEPS